MNVSSWLKQTKTRIDTLDAELILLNVLNQKDRSFLVAHEDKILSQEELDKLEEYVKKREKKVPLVYITFHREFYGRDFSVNENVLIPRIESEEIIDIALQLYNEKKLGETPKMLDVGTGSGCLAISLKLEIPDAVVNAVDISEKALEVARKNASRLGAEVEFLKSDLMKEIRDEKFDLIVANLPYVDKDWDFLSPELGWEPEEALYAQNKGLEVIFRMIDEVISCKNTKYLILESDISQQQEITKYAEEKGLKIIETRGYQLVFEI